MSVELRLIDAVPSPDRKKINRVMANEPDFNIYDDLDDALMEPLEKDVEKSRAEAVAKGAAEKELQGLLERKDEEIKRLKELNQQLQTNMSTLLLTIKSELSRRVGFLFCINLECFKIADRVVSC